MAVLSILPDSVLFWMMVAGVIALIFGARRGAPPLIMPGVLRWVAWPFVAPFIYGAVRVLPTWEIVLAIPFILLVPVFAALKWFQIAISALYGRHVSVRVTSSALIATFRLIGRVMRAILFLPIRMFERRRQMDDLLRDWRRG